MNQSIIVLMVCFLWNAPEKFQLHASAPTPSDAASSTEAPLIECGICYEEKPPASFYMLDCGHRYCLSCEEKQASNTPTETCPLCRKQFPLPENSIELKEREIAIFLRAAESGKIFIVTQFCSFPGNDINATEIPGHSTALMYAAANGHLPIVNTLLENPRILVNVPTARGETALMFAISYRQDAVAHALINAGANVNAESTTQQTPLMLAIEKNNTSMVATLLSQSASPNVQDNTGKTPLIWAVENQQLEIVTMLLTAGADVNIPDSNGNSVFMIAAGGGFLDIAKIILESQPEVIHARNTKGQTALMIATDNCWPSCTEMVNFLVQKEADINAQDAQGKTALIHATEKENDVIVLCLLNISGIEVNILDTSGRSALMHAAQLGYPNMTKLLLDAPGINVNLQNERKETALMYAACASGIKWHKAEIVTLLLNKRANPNVTDTSGFTARQIAEKGPMEDVIAKFREYNELNGIAEAK